jgi:hemolysin activation/secretion protein
MSLPRYHRQYRFVLAVLPMLAGSGAAFSSSTIGLDAGSLMREAPQPVPMQRSNAPVLPRVPVEAQVTAPQDGPKVTVKSVRFHGVRAFPEATLLDLVAEAQGKTLDGKQLQALSERITAYYRAQGYLLARAYLPTQRMTEGAVEIAVAEGRLSRLSIDANTPAEAAQVQSYLTDLHLGEPLQSMPLERDLLLLSDLPGVKVLPSLLPGETVGTSHLDVQIKSTRAVNGSVTLDNHGNHYTGEARVSSRINIANSFFLGDSLDLSAAYAGPGFHYGRLAWQTPVGGHGVQVGVAGAVMGDTLGQEAASLQASGRASDFTLYALQPLVRSRTLNVQAQGAWDIKRFDDTVLGSTSTKQVQVLSLGLSGSAPVLWGATSQGSVTLTLGRLQNGYGDPTNGDYAKISFQGEYQQPVGRTTAITVKVSGQGAGKNLDTSEKIALGGPQGVRAYGVGEGAADDALLARTELRRTWADNSLQTKVFVDAAKGIPAHTALPGNSAHIRNLAGAGLGLDVKLLPYDVLFQTAIAWRMVGLASTHLDRSPRLWALLTKAF